MGWLDGARTRDDRNHTPVNIGYIQTAFPLRGQLVVVYIDE